MKKYLYRYQAFARIRRKRQRLEDLIVKNARYDSSPLWFNDPFDCKSLFSTKGTTAHHINMFCEEFVHTVQEQIRDDGFSPEDAKREMIARLSTPRGMRAYLEESRDINQRLLERVAILCFSETPTDILIWSHYADGHRGLCLQFNKAVLGRVPGALVKVHYRPEYPVFREYVRLKTRQAKNRFLLARKSDRWRYEREWRLVRQEPRGLAGFAQPTGKFPDDALTGIIFGCEMSERRRRHVRDLVRQRRSGTPVQFCEAVRKTEEYGVAIRKLTYSR